MRCWSFENWYIIVVKDRLLNGPTVEIFFCMLFAHGSYQRLSSVSAYCRKYRTLIFSAFYHNSYCVFHVDYESGTKPKSVAKILATNFSWVPDWLCQKPAGQWAYNGIFSNCQHPAKYTQHAQQQIIEKKTRFQFSKKRTKEKTCSHWCHCVLTHGPLECLFNSLFRLTTKKPPKLRIIGLLWVLDSFTKGQWY